MRSLLIEAVLASLLIVTGDTSAAPKGKTELVQSIQDCRAAFLQLVRSGRCTLLVQHSSHQRGKAEEVSKPHQIECIFSDDDVLYREFAADQPPQLVQSTLKKGGKYVRYFAGHPSIKAAPAVTIMKPPSPRAWQVKLPEWSLQELLRIPESDERVFFSYIRDSQLSRIEEDGQLIRVIMDEPVPVKASFMERRTYTFDMSRGGMLVSFLHQQKRPQEDKEWDASEKWDQTWKDHNGVWLPNTRRSEVTVRLGGDVILHSLLSVELISCSLERIPAEDLHPQKMNIPDGTAVQDEVIGITWRFFKGAADALLDSDGRDSAKPSHK